MRWKNVVVASQIIVLLDCFLVHLPLFLLPCLREHAEAFQLHLATRARCHLWQRKYEREIIVGSDTVEAFEFTTGATVNDHVLAIWTLKVAKGFHRSTTVAAPVARALTIHVTGVEAIWAVVAVLAAADGRCYEMATMLAFEDLFSGTALMVFTC